MTEYRVPLIDIETGEGWDEVVEATTASEAIEVALDQADHDDPHVSTTYLRKHDLLPEDRS